MPAQTPIYGLPYMVGTDPPCFGPGTGCDNLVSVFCEFAEIVEGLLDANDLIIGRTATAIPMAMIELDRPDNPLDVSFLTVIPFDTVVFDTDNMAFLTASDGFEIRPQRNGHYHIDFIASVNENTAGDPFAGQIAGFEISIGNDELAPNVAVATASATLYAGNLTWLRSSTLYEFSDTAPIPRSIFVNQFFSTFPDLALYYANLAVYWHSDL